MIRTFSRIMSASVVMQCREGRRTCEYITGIFGRRGLFIAEGALEWTGLIYFADSAVKVENNVENCVNWQTHCNFSGDHGLVCLYCSTLKMHVLFEE